MTALANPDAIFEALAEEYAALDEDGVARFHARLILLLIAQVSDDAKVHEAIRTAAGRLENNG